MNSEMKFQVDNFNFLLRPLTEKDGTEEYLSWLNDKYVTKYTESRFSTHTLESLYKFICIANTDSNKTFAIIDSNNNRHIGNIKIGNINVNHKFADIGLLIGNKEYWGKGIASNAIGLVTKYAFKVLNLHCVSAGIYANNIASIKAFEKCGYHLHWVDKQRYKFEDKYIDCFCYIKFRDEMM